MATGTLRLYIDESGDFASVATHVVCAVVVPASVDVKADTFEAVWAELGLDWRTFHATNHRPEKVAQYVAHFRERLAPSKIDIVYVWHQNRRRYGHSFYFPLVARAISEAWRQALPSYLSAAPAPSSVSCLATLEMRTHAMNTAPLRERVHGWCRRWTRDAGGSFGTNLRVAMVEKGSSPLLQIADLFANACFRARATQGAGPHAWLDGLPAQHVDEDWICAPAQIELELAVSGAGPSPLPPPVISRSIEQLRAETLLDRARAAQRRGKRLTAADCRATIAELLDESLAARAAQVTLLLDSVPRIADEEREYELAEDLTEVTDAIIGEEERRAEHGRDLLDQWTLRATSNWILVRNHRGQVCAREPRVEEALALARRIKGNPRHWEATATLLNYVTVNLHNALEFAEAERRLGADVDFYLGPGGAPPGAELGAPWIGALVGTHAQTKAFTAHDRFFADRGASLREALRQAREYSEYASLHFSEREDLLRQETYRAHMFMQEAMLLGDPAALAAAGELLAATLSPEEAVAEFLGQFPSAAATVRAHRVGALLKHAWLGKARPAWVGSLEAGILRAAHALPEQHPYEQVVGYLALLSNGPARARFRGALRETGWRGLLRVIARCFDAQLEYDELRRVTPERLAELRAEARASLPAGWLSGQLHEELTRYSDQGGGRAPGPLVLLPFNFS